MTDKYDFLAQLPLFDALTDAELAALDAITEEFEFDKGAVIAYQRDMADSLYIVKSGRLYAQAVDDRGIVRDTPETRPYLPGQWFGDSWLFVPGAHPATVKATSNGRLLIIRGSDFLPFLEKHPDVLEALEPEHDDTDGHIGGLSEEAWAEAQKSRMKANKRSTAVSLLPEELVELYLRRSHWYLLLRILLPAIGLLAVPLWLFTLLSAQPAESFWQGLPRLGLPLLFVLIFGVWLAFQLLDWSNDYFVITSKHLIHREFSLRTFRTTVTKIPIDQIQSVAVDRPTFIANLFDFGTARVTTAAQKSAIYFDNIDDPRQVEEVLNRLRQRVQALDAALAQTTMRRSVESHFHVPPGYDMVAEEKSDDAVATAVPPTSSLSTFWRNFKRRYQGRVEDGNTVTYRKHLFILLKAILWPTVSLLGFLILNWILLTYSQFTLQNLLIIDVIALLGLLAWLTWQVEDWRNDTFQVTDRYVIDIDRKPFGFGESRKQAELSNVQNINSDRPNFWATLFNFGNVVIDTAGAQADIVFETVSNPNQVQSDIFKRRDQYRRQQAIKQGDQRRKEYAVLLDVYKQAEEQGRIPRRTPIEEFDEG
ncbi:MAG: cyclic nucleotide-binding domain-containing protein [Ardenticatenaceae bacterium]|nr:cyclic nucleotide-binding domain-containing protein [Ardenticatenaceae bacterium]